MKGHITYAPLFRYLRMKEISHEQFMEDMGIDVTIMDLLMRNGSMSTDFIESVCTKYGLSVNMVMTMNYELPQYGLLFSPRENTPLPTLLDLIDDPTAYLADHEFRLNEILVGNVTSPDPVLIIQIEPLITNDEDFFFKSMEYELDVYNPERLKIFFDHFREKNPKVTDGMELVKVVNVYWALEPIMRDPNEHKTNLAYHKGNLVIICDFSEANKADEEKGEEKKDE